MKLYDEFAYFKKEIVEIRDDLNGITLNISERRRQLKKLEKKYTELLSDLKYEISSIGEGIGIGLDYKYGLLNRIYAQLDRVEERINRKEKNKV